MQEYNKFWIALAGGVVAILNAVGVGIDFASIEGMLTIIVPAVTAIGVGLFPNIGDQFERISAYVDKAKDAADTVSAALDKVPSPTKPE